MSSDKEKYFASKYRIPTARLQNWDYQSNAAYFVTICTQNRDHYFGDIVETQDFASSYKMQLSEIGELANKYWNEIPQHFPFVKLGAFVVMPNHVHGIIIIDNDNANANANADDADGNDGNDGNDGVETLHATSLPPTPPTPIIEKNKEMASISPKRGSLSSIIRSYKSQVSKNARKIHADFAWQSRFYDHIIRDDKSFQTITEYIESNVLNWEKDKFNLDIIK